MTTAGRPTRILAVASAGGHWVQMLRLRPAWEGLDVTYVTTDPSLGAELATAARVVGKPAPGFRVITEANRWWKWRLLRQMVELLFVILRTRPDMVLTTGASPGYFALRIGHFLGAKTIWIDSIANTEEMSLSGQKVRRYADLWLTQWKHLATAEGPHYLGAVL